MSQISYRGNLSSSHFPFSAKQHGQTIIVPGRDQAFQNQIVVNQDSEDRDKGIPQLYYCHNVMPTVEGIQSVGFDLRLTGLGVGVNSFDDVYLLRDIDENKFLFSPANGNNYVYDGNNNNWTSAGAAVVTSSAIVTVAFINGRTFICYQEDNIYEYDPGTGLLVAVSLTGITVGDIVGICASSGFLIAWDDDNTVYRSQPLDILNFTPDPALGSGSSIPADLKGKIVAILPIANGFIMYTTKNAVSATFSKNIRYPFDYAEIQGSAGIRKPQHVAWANNLGVHYAWTLAGLQKVDKVRSLPVFPEVTDFLTAKIYEDFNTTTYSFVEEKLAVPLELKVVAIAQRFLVISYGKEFPFTFALIYDLGLKRWGKVKLTHVTPFELAIPNKIGGLTWADLTPLTWSDLGDTSWSDLGSEGVATQEKPKETVAFVQSDGTVYTVNFDNVHTGDTGVAITGKYQFVRERFITLQEIELENIEQNYNFIIKQLSSVNGKTISSVTTPFLSENSEEYRKYNASIEAKNHSLAYIGTFNLGYFGLKFTVGGHS